MLVEMAGVGFTYMPGTPFEQVALKSIDLSISEGEFIGLIGPTGSGKSTLIQHLNGLLTPTEGKIIFRGQEVGKDIELHSAQKEIGLVFQFPETQLFAETVAKDIAFGPKNLGLPVNEVESRVREAIESVGLDYRLYARRSPFGLSGGEKRLVAIAGVLATKPRLLILDEPLSGLDLWGKTKVMQAISKLNKNGAAVVLVAHDMDEIVEHVGRVIVLNEGRVALDDKPEVVFTQIDYLRRIGLDVPKTVELFIKLKERGFDIAPKSFNLRIVINTVLALAREGQCL